MESGDGVYAITPLCLVPKEIGQAGGLAYSAERRDRGCAPQDGAATAARERAQVYTKSCWLIWCIIE